MLDDDRRRVVNAGVRHGRDAAIANLRATAEVGVESMTSDVIATRGERLALSRDRFASRPAARAFHDEVLIIAEIDADNRIVAARRVRSRRHRRRLRRARRPVPRRRSGRVHAHMVGHHREAYAAFNRRELPATTPDWVDIDHRRVERHSRRANCPHISVPRGTSRQTSAFYIEAVHRLNDLGAVVTHAGAWDLARGLRRRVADDQSLDGRRRPDQPLRSSSTRQTSTPRSPDSTSSTCRRRGWKTRQAKRYERFWTHFAARDWAAMAEAIGRRHLDDDRRRVVNAGVRHGRDAEIADMRATAELGVENMSTTVIATRGERLVLSRVRFSGRVRSEAFNTEVLGIVEIDADNRIVATVAFDARRPRRRLRGARCPISRRRSGRRTRTRGRSSRGLRRVQPARTRRDDTGLGEHRPPARDSVRAR